MTQTTSYTGLTTTSHQTSAGVSLFVSERTRSLLGTSVIMKYPDADGDGIAESSGRSINYGIAGTTVTSTAADGGETITVNYIDGRAKSVAGTAVTGSNTSEMTYEYGIHSVDNGGTYTIVTQPNGTQTTKSYRDKLGRNFRTENADGSFSTVSYYSASALAGSKGKLETLRDADEVALAGKGSHVSYVYNSEGQREKTTSKLSNNQQVVTEVITEVADVAGFGKAFRSVTKVNNIITNTTLQSIDGYNSQSTRLAGTASSVRSVPIDGAWTTTNTAANGAFSVQNYTDGLMKSATAYDSSTPALQISQATVTHDAFGRVLTQVDGRTGTVTYGAYLENGAVTGVTDAAGRTTTYTYDNMGRTITVDAPDTTTEVNGSNVTLANVTHTS